MNEASLCTLLVCIFLSFALYTGKPSLLSAITGYVAVKAECGP